MKEAYIFDAVRTPRGKGKLGGALYEVKPIDLLATTFQALANRNQLPTEKVADAIIGCVTPVDSQGYNIAKSALLRANWSHTVCGMQVNRFCTSGLEAVNLAALKVVSGFVELAVAGGIESMSRVPITSDGGALINDPEIINQVSYLPPGVAADLIASLEGFSRQTIDEYALLSQQRAAHAIQNGHFNRSIVAVKDRNGLVLLDKDEHPRPHTELEKLMNLRPAFRRLGQMGYDAMALQQYPELEEIQHVHTAGNSSGIVDGAAAILVGSKEIGEALHLTPRAKIRSFGAASVEPTIMLTGTLPATQKALTLAGMTPQDIDLWECNEAFASVVLKFQKTFDLPSEKLNVNGGAIALGHPLGATGAILLGTLLDELERQDLNTGLVTLCGGAGMGVATIIERIG